VFLVTDGRGDYQVLPGALTRVALGDRLSVSAQRGGASKDTWVLADGPMDDHARRPVQELAPAQAGRRTVTSRAAEHLFWLGRYAERSENAARLTRTILARLTEGGALPATLVACMVRTCGEEGLLTPEELAGPFAALDSLPPAALVAALADGVFDRSARAGLGFDVAQTTRAAGAVRERLSYDNWRVLAQLARRLAPRTRADATLDDTLEAVDDAILSLVAAGGLEMAHMTRDDGWRFLSLGRHLERLAFVSGTLIGIAEEGGTEEPAVLDWVLELSDSLITYRTRYRRLPDWPAVMALLLLDVRNPRAILFQVGKLAKHTRLLPGDALAELVHALETVERTHGDSDADGAPDLPVSREAAGELLVTCQQLAQRVSDALTLQYFSHVADAQHATVNA
jgi:uncharacterized alpha-E superfamily protein